MQLKTREQLGLARQCFETFQLREAYKILRRYYDRLPFAPDELHVEYITIFARTLIELGKEREIEFYIAELERLYAKNRSPSIAYPLAMLYLYASEPRWNLARSLLEKLVMTPESVEYRIKGKMLLAFYYERKGSTADTHALIESITEAPTDPVLQAILGIWRASVALDRNRSEQGIELLRSVLGLPIAKRRWDIFFSAQIELTGAYLKIGAKSQAQQILGEIDQYFSHRPVRSIQIQLEVLRAKIEKSQETSPLQNVTARPLPLRARTGLADRLASRSRSVKQAAKL